jgi:hypothetical protein
MPTTTPPRYSTPQLIRIESGSDFWYLMDTMQDGQCAFLDHKNVIADAFKVGKLYGLCCEETDAMYAARMWRDKIFHICPHAAERTLYLLPCFCITSWNSLHEALMMWVHPYARRRGFATSLVHALHITKAYHPAVETMPFWTQVLPPERAPSEGVEQKTCSS